MKHTLSLAALTLFTATALAQTPAAPAAPASAPAPAPSQYKPLLEKMDLKDGDSIVFLGDSITHQCLYTQYVEDYFYTRYPKMRLHFHNSGVGGDRASDALARFDEDVAAYHPKYVTILLGMNDGAYRDFDAAVFTTYQKGMTEILEKIGGLNATAIPMTPTMFDARAKRLRKEDLEPRNTYYNGVLALYGAWLREEAEVRGLGFVDMYSPLNNLTDTQRKTKPDWTMIPDGVHPGPAGHTIMATAIIENIVAHSQVSQIVIAEKDGKNAATAANGTVTDLLSSDGKMSFTFTGNALPWVLPADTADGARLAALGHHYSNEKVTVRNLKPGTYELTIDGTSVGKFTDGQLAFGVELEGNEKTPEYQQAMKVAMLNKDRNDKAYHPMRDQYAQLKGKRRDLNKVDANDPQHEAKVAEFEAFHTAQKERVAELLAAAKTIEDQIYQANQPQPRKYELALVK